jgi:hypothetical protein
MRWLHVLCWTLVLACLCVRAAPSSAAGPVYRCVAYGFQIPVPSGWHVPQAQCGRTGNAQLFESNDGHGHLFVVAAQPGFDFTHFAHDMQRRLADAAPVAFGTLRAGDHMYGTARFTYGHGGGVAYYVAVNNTGYFANHLGVVLLFSAYVTRTANRQADTELAQVQKAIGAVQLFTPQFTIKLKTGLPLAEGLARTLTVVFFVLALSVLVLVRKLVATGQLLLGLLVLALGATLLVFVLPYWPTAACAVAGWVALVSHLAAWPFRAAAARRGARRHTAGDRPLPHA